VPCPVCFDSADGNRAAFFATTALLSILPLAMLGGLLIYLRRRARTQRLPDQTSQPL